MKRLLSFGIIILSAVLAGCGGSGNTITGQAGGGGTPGANADVASISLLASTTQILTDQNGNQAVNLTALVRDSNNVVVEGAVVSFSSTSGILAVPTPLTDVNGVVTATLTTQAVANGNITVTVSVQNTAGATMTDSVTIQVTGTQLVITGPSSLAQGQIGTFTVSLRDGQGAGIQGQAVNVTSTQGNTISAMNLTTDAGGQAQFDLTATQPGADTVNATALGIVSPITVNVSNDSFTFTAPLQDAEVGLGVAEPVTVLWEKAGVPQAGQTITFSATRGTLSAGSAVTNASGIATVTVTSTNAGPAVITATNPESTTATVGIEFVADTAATLVLQADPFTVTTGQVSTLEAVVRDPAGNLVKNKVIVFELTDVTGGFLSVASDITDSQGRARTSYTAGASPSAQNGVQIHAFVQDTPAVQDTVSMTVASQELFFVIGTGNDIFEPSSSLFANEWAIIVTDVDGNPVPNKAVQVNVVSNFYWKGVMEVDTVNNVWRREVGAVQCTDEDSVPGPGARNGILDPGEDFNNSGKIEAGNVAAVAPFPASGDCANVAAGTTQTTVTTNAAGFARVCVVYPQDHNLWVDVGIEVKASVVSGTEFSSSQQFLLPAKAADLTNTQGSPPGVVSPFGPDLNCSIPPP